MVSLVKYAISCEDDPSLHSELTRDLRYTNFQIVASIQFNIKTHKHPGLVVPGVIHANHRSPFKPGARLVASWLRETISGLPHLIRDSAHLVKLLQSTPVPAGNVLVKVDIKDFFMTGAHEALVESCNKYVSKRRRPLEIGSSQADP